MRAFLAPFVLLLVVMGGGISATYVACPGCINRNRVNKSCEWTGDAAFPIDPQNAAHQAHLIADAQLAEELAIRYADAEFNRLYGHEGHGGLLENGRVRNGCMARLVDVITQSHAVTTEQVHAARGQRNLTFDFAAMLLFVPLYSLGATNAGRRLGRRFSSQPRSVRLVATGLASIAASVLGLQVGQLWLSVWEFIRVGNGHISAFRTASHTQWSHQHVGALFVAAVVVFWLMALLCYRDTPDDELDAEDRSAAVILAR
jgi:hypothetical protein